LESQTAPKNQPPLIKEAAEPDSCQGNALVDWERIKAEGDSADTASDLSVLGVDVAQKCLERVA